MAKQLKPLRWSLLFAGILLAGCIFETDQRVAGGAEDFPNTLQPLGEAVSGDLGGQADWDQFGNIPAGLPSFHNVDTLALQPGISLGAKDAAAKTAATSQTALKPDTTWDLSDSATLGVARRFIAQELLLKYRRDTTVFRYDAAFKDGVPGNETVLISKGLEAYRLTKQVQTYRYENRDSTGALDYGVFFLRTLGSDGYYRSSLFIASGGADKDIFTKADNVPVYYAFAKTDENGGGKIDTVDAFDISDADGDGLLWGANDSGLVDFRQKKTNPDGRPGVKTIVQKMRALLFKDEAKTYPVSFTEIRTDKDDKKVVFSVKGTRADSAFGPGDTVFVSVKTTPAPGFTRFQERNARFVILLSPTPKLFKENRLLNFSLETTWRPDAWKKGGVTHTRVHFKPDQSVLSAHLADSGSVDVDADFSDGSSGTVTGRLQNGRIEVEFTEQLANGNTRRFRVHWDINGIILLQEKL